MLGNLYPLPPQTGPKTSVTLAPLRAKSRANKMPVVPVALLEIIRMLSIATHVGPAVIKIRLFLKFIFSAFSYQHPAFSSKLIADSRKLTAANTQSPVTQPLNLPL